MTGISLKRAKRWRRGPRYDRLCDEAIQSCVERMEAEADRRGVDGYDDPIFFEGQQVGTVRRYSDQLLMLTTILTADVTAAPSI